MSNPLQNILDKNQEVFQSIIGLEINCLKIALVGPEFNGCYILFDNFFVVIHPHNDDIIVAKIETDLSKFPMYKDGYENEYGPIIRDHNALNQFVGHKIRKIKTLSNVYDGDGVQIFFEEHSFSSLTIQNVEQKEDDPQHCDALQFNISYHFFYNEDLDIFTEKLRSLTDQESRP